MAYEAMLAETVLIRGHRGDQIDAYLARPFGAGPYPGGVVIHHMPGWDGATKEIARRFAHQGYVAILPNLHFREGKATPEENSASVRAAGGMPDDRTMGDVQGAIDYLRALPYLGGKVGIIDRPGGDRLPPRLAVSRRQGRDHRLLLRRPPGLPGRLHAPWHRRRHRLLRGWGRGQARGADPTPAGRPHRVHQEPPVPASGIVRHRGRTPLSGRRGQDRASPQGVREDV